MNTYPVAAMTLLSAQTIITSTLENALGQEDIVCGGEECRTEDETYDPAVSYYARSLRELLTG